MIVFLTLFYEFTKTKILQKKFFLLFNNSNICMYLIVYPHRYQLHALLNFLFFSSLSFLFYFFVLVEKEGETGGRWKIGRVGNGWGWWRDRGGIEGGKVCV